MEAIKTEAFAFSDQATEMPEGTNMDTFNLINTLNTHIHTHTRTYPFYLIKTLNTYIPAHIRTYTH